LFARHTKSNRKLDDGTLKKAVFALLHEPPSNYDINRTTWIMPDLCRVLQEKGQPACPEVIRAITKAAGYDWRKARIVLTSNDPAFSSTNFLPNTSNNHSNNTFTSDSGFEKLHESARAKVSEQRNINS